MEYIKKLPKEGYCDECGEFVPFYLETRQNRTLKVKGVEVTSTEFVGHCAKCHNEIWIDEVENINCNNFYNEYKKIVGLLTKEEIIAIRKKRKMSQRDLARFLSIGEKDITRYENGAIQTRAVDLMIRMVDDDEAFLKMSQVVEKAKLIASKVPM